MRLGSTHLWADALDSFRRELRLARELGYEIITVGDSPVAWRDLYVSLSVMAAEVPGAMIGPMVTAPFIRHPVVTAGAMSALAELTDGRAVLSLGRGGSLTAGIGRAAANQTEMRDYILAVRALLDGKPIVWDGHQVTAMRYVRKVPIYYSALGPKALAMAGELADGVVLFAGPSLEDIDQKIAAVRAAAAKAGRNPADIDIWVASHCAVGATQAAAVRDVLAYLAAFAGFMVLAPGGLDAVPAELRDKFEAFAAQFDPAQLWAVGGANNRLIEELGLVDFLMAIAGIVAGTPGEVGAFLQGLSDRGVSCFLCTLYAHANPAGILRDLRALAPR